MILLIQARLNSSRVPNKVLYQINGKSLLGYLIKRLKGLTDYEICIATSDQSSDDEIEYFCEKNCVPNFRGSLYDVAKRMLDAAEYFNAHAFVRINGDSPLMDPQIIEQGIECYQNKYRGLIDISNSESPSIKLPNITQMKSKHGCEKDAILY